MNPAAFPAGYRIGHDGDVVFALAPGGPTPPILARLRVGAAAAHCAAQAIAAAVR